MATLLTYRPTDTNPLLVDWVTDFLGIDDENRIKELRQSFPFAIVQGVLLTVVFYLMVNLFHRALYVLRNYAYLGALEDEIRDSMRLNTTSVAFTRESTFYWHDRPRLLSTVKWFYVLLLGGLLSAFLYGRITGDWQSDNKALVWVDIAVAIPIAIYFVGYAWYTLLLDSKTAIVGKVPAAQSEPGPQTHEGGTNE